MRRETQDFLDRVRDAENPTRLDEARVQDALRAAVAAGAVASLPPNAFRDLGSADQLLRPLAGWGSKFCLLGAVAAAAFGTGDTPRSSGATAAPIAAAPIAAAAIAAAPTAAAPTAALAAPLEAPSAPASAPSADTARQARPPSTPAVRASTRERPAASLQAELALLRRVQAALQRGDGQAALRELDAHVTSDRTLLPERRAARILALCQLGRVDAARLARAEFAREHPDSVQREAVERACTNL